MRTAPRPVVIFAVTVREQKHNLVHFPTRNWVVVIRSVSCSERWMCARPGSLCGWVVPTPQFNLSCGPLHAPAAAAGKIMGIPNGSEGRSKSSATAFAGPHSLSWRCDQAPYCQLVDQSLPCLTGPPYIRAITPAKALHIQKVQKH